MASYKQNMQRHFHEFEREHGSERIDLKAVAAWMIREGLWEVPPSNAIDMCASELADALRLEYRTDAQGRRYRANHAVREKQGTFWADLDFAPRHHMEKAFAQRRQHIVGECVQLSTDVDVYNDKNSEEEPITMPFDFTYDIEEAKLVKADDAA